MEGPTGATSVRSSRVPQFWQKTRVRVILVPALAAFDSAHDLGEELLGFEGFGLSDFAESPPDDGVEEGDESFLAACL